MMIVVHNGVLNITVPIHVLNTYINSPIPGIRASIAAKI